MDDRRPGRTGLQVSRFCFGTMQWGWTADEPTAFAVMDALPQDVLEEPIWQKQPGSFLVDVYSRLFTSPCQLAE